MERHREKDTQRQIDTEAEKDKQRHNKHVWLTVSYREARSHKEKLA